MTRGLKYFITWLSILLVAVLAMLYRFFPNSDTIVVMNKEIFLPYFADWSTFIFQMSVLIIPAIVSIVAIIVLPKKTTPGPLLILLALMLFINCWFIWHMLDRLREISNHSILATLLFAGLIVAGVFLIRRYRSASEREKKMRLLHLISQIDKEDLPEILMRIENVRSAAANVKEPVFAAGWKHLFEEEANESRAVISEMAKKIRDTRKESD